MNLVYLRSSRLHIFKFEPWFMHWQEGGERKVEKSCIASLEPIPRVKGELVHFFCIFGFWGVWSAVRYQPDRFWEPVWPVLVEPVRPVLVEPVWPVCAQVWNLFRGSMHMCRGSSCMLWWFVLFAWAWFCLGCVEPLPLPKGSETCLLQVILLPFLSFRSLVAVSSFLFISFIFFLFSDYQMCVLLMYSSRGRLRTMCGSRTGGWSLPSVMSDWQRCVD
jgi:hypothetical protein